MSGAKLSIEAYFKSDTSSRAEEIPAALPLHETPASGTLQNLLRQLQHRQNEFPPGLVHDLLEAMSVLRAWQIVRQPTKTQRDAMAKTACKIWKVPRRVNGTLRSIHDIATDLENLLVSNAAELLNGSVDRHTHWQLLGACTLWMQQQCRATPSLSECFDNNAL